MSGRRLLAALVLSACLTVGVAACGGGDDGTQARATTTTAKPTSTDKALPLWAQRVCVALGSWRAALERVRVAGAGPAAGTDPAAARVQLTQAFSSAADASDDLLADLARIGAAPTGDGVEAATQLRRAVMTARDELAYVADGAQGLPVDSIESYNAARAALVAEALPALSAASAAIDGSIKAPALDKAFATAPACS
jgi:hypothetical protein